MVVRTVRRRLLPAAQRRELLTDDDVIVVHGDQGIPRGLTGKVLKRVLRERLAHGEAA